jgi:hypothetical protein
MASSTPILNPSGRLLESAFLSWRHDDGGAETGANSRSSWLTRNGRKAYIAPPRCANAIGAMAHLRSSSFVSGVFSGFGRKGNSSKLSGFPEGCASGEMFAFAV